MFKAIKYIYSHHLIIRNESNNGISSCYEYNVIVNLKFTNCNPKFRKSKDSFATLKMFVTQDTCGIHDKFLVPKVTFVFLGDNTFRPFINLVCSSYPNFSSIRYPPQT